MKPGPSGPQREGWRTQPHTGRLALDHPLRGEILARHERAMEASLSSYLDPATGYSVLTAAYLDERGYCCSQGCRHCPWEGAQGQERRPIRVLPPDSPAP